MSEPLPAVVYGALSKKATPTRPASPASTRPSANGSTASEAARSSARSKDDGSPAPSATGAPTWNGPSRRRRVRAHGRPSCGPNSRPGSRAAAAQGPGPLAAGAVHAMRRAGVALRTVHDDEFVDNELLIGFASRQASKYSRRPVRVRQAGQAAPARPGRPLGGPLPDGYLRAGRQTLSAPTRPARPSVSPGRRRRARRPHRPPLNADGHRTRTGSPWTRGRCRPSSRTRSTPARSPTSAARPDERIVPGPHPPCRPGRVGRRSSTPARPATTAPGAQDRPAEHEPRARQARRPAAAAAAAWASTTSSYRRKRTVAAGAPTAACQAHDCSGICDAPPDRRRDGGRRRDRGAGHAAGRLRRLGRRIRDRVRPGARPPGGRGRTGRTRPRRPGPPRREGRRPLGRVWSPPTTPRPTWCCPRSSANSRPCSTPRGSPAPPGTRSRPCPPASPPTGCSTSPTPSKPPSGARSHRTLRWSRSTRRCARCSPSSASAGPRRAARSGDPIEPWLLADAVPARRRLAEAGQRARRCRGPA